MFATQQRSFDDLGTPLHDVTFCVLDVETTGGSPAEHAITEIGAVKFRGGELLGHFETLVNPGMAIPPLITVLTGITEAMVLPAPKIAEVLPHFLEFLGDSVIVGHNVRFDISFFDAALVAHGFEALSNRRTDTLALARRLVRDEVPNLKLGTLARHLRVPTEPNHRAMADARATAEVFHVLLERAATFGVLGLDDLIGLPSMHAHPSAQKLGLTASLPRSPGVYIFRDRAGRPLYVGKATNLRARVRSYFSGDDRRKIPQLLREVDRIDHIVCHDPIEAAVREIRLIQQWQPRFNRQGKLTRRYTYMKLTDERFPRIITTRVAKAGDGIYLGPLPSRRSAELVREAIETVVPLRRCTTRLSRRTPLPVCDGACTADQERVRERVGHQRDAAARRSSRCGAAVRRCGVMMPSWCWSPPGWVGTWRCRCWCCSPWRTTAASWPSSPAWRSLASVSPCVPSGRWSSGASATSWAAR